MKALALAIALAAASTASIAQAYRWVDEKGKVHYGDRPPSTASASVPGTRSAKPREGGPIEPGMKPDEVKAMFGEPDEVRTVTTRMGQAQYWAYRKPPKGQKTSYTIKFEAGSVAEVEQGSQTAAAQPGQAAMRPAAAGAPPPPAGAREGAVQTSAAAPQAVRQDPDAAARERDCARVRESARETDARMRAGASAQQMDRMRDERRRYDQKLSELGC